LKTWPRFCIWQKVSLTNPVTTFNHLQWCFVNVRKCWSSQLL
jgi:hypothetical protein